MAERAVFVTGFPGFIAGRLIERLVSAREGRFYLLAEARFVLAARERCLQIEREHPAFAGRWTIVEGDIRRADLGLPIAVRERLRAEVVEVWHLAAIYDLAVPAALAYSVNVDGTLHVLDLCDDLPRLERLQYVSTCFVAGDRGGRVYEDELDRGQGFKNHYESTKHWAERHVRHRMARLPTTIYRPSIVVGDSRTGETAKGDGPYFVMNLLLRLPAFLPMVHLGESLAHVNLVPVDFVLDAMVALSADPRALGKTFHLADPDPMQAREILNQMCAAIGRAPVVATVPDRIASRLVARRGVQRLLGVPGEAFVYFSHPVLFDTSNTSALLEGRLPPCPALDRYLPTLVAYAQANPRIFQRQEAR